MVIPQGEVQSLQRYPVKSMQGECLENVQVSTYGLLGDRGYAVQDMETGHIVNAKHPEKWRTMLDSRAHYDCEPSADNPFPPIIITLPDGVEIRSDDPEVDRRLSDSFGRSVRLVRTGAVPEPTREADRADVNAAEPDIRIEPMGRAAPEGGFFDYAPLHIVSTATLTYLSKLYPRGVFDLRRFRANVVVDLATEPGPLP
ncbi:MAG: sulfurase, partial [Chloroflexi bacterium]|nr:sulfurase [Chloroflexota bacterium]